MRSPQATVVVCTRDRDRWLDGCLEHLWRQRAEPSSFEVVVVDNDSSDATADVVRSHERSAPVPLRLAHEPRLGLSHARNTGLAAASAPVVAFLDDDARAGPGWLAALLDAWAALPTASVVGGPVALSWPAGRPAWLSPTLEPWYSRLDLGPTRRVLDTGETLYGANFSVRRDLAIGTGGFDPRLGRRGRTLHSGEEWDLIERLRSFGDVVYDPALHVTHEVLPDRLSVGWLLRRTFAHGRAATAGGTPVARRDDVGAAVRSLRAAGSGVRPATRRVRRGSPPSAALVQELSRRSIALGEASARLGRALRPSRLDGDVDVDE